MARGADIRAKRVARGTGLLNGTSNGEVEPQPVQYGAATVRLATGFSYVIRKERWFDLATLLAHANRHSPLSVLREYIVAILHHRVAREPALRVVFPRRIVRCVGGPKSIG
jgi:hypothetical protein